MPTRISGYSTAGTEKLIEYKTYMQAVPYFDRAGLRRPDVPRNMPSRWPPKSCLVSRCRARPIHPGAVRRDQPAAQPHPQHLHLRARCRCDDAVPVGVRGTREDDGVLRTGERRAAACRLFRPGGVHRDLPAGLAEDIAAFCETFPKFIDDTESLLTENRIFKQRSVDIGIISAEDALDWGLSGPMLRATGMAWDLRKAQPYEVYERMDFDIPWASTAIATTAIWCASRRCARAFGSSSNAWPRCRAVRSGTEDHKITPPRRGEMKASMEALIHHFKLYTEGYHVPAGETYTAVEAPKGEFGVYLGLRRHQQALSLQDPRAGLRLPAGHRVHGQGPHAGRPGRDRRLDGYRVRGGRPMSEPEFSLSPRTSIWRTAISRATRQGARLGHPAGARHRPAPEPRLAVARGGRLRRRNARYAADPGL